MESIEDALQIIRSQSWDALDLSYQAGGINTSDMQRILISIQGGTCKLQSIEMQQLRPVEGVGDSGASFISGVISYCTTLRSLHLGK